MQVHAPRHIHIRVTVAPGLRREVGLGFIDIDSVDTDPMCGWGLDMGERGMERLVLDVVRSVIGDELEHLTLETDLGALGVDQLTITYIVLALENRLRIELPTHLEDARTVAALTAGVREALRANAAARWQVTQCVELTPAPEGRSASGHLSYQSISLSNPPRQRRRRVHRWLRLN